MRRTLTIAAIVIALLVAVVVAAVFTQPRPKLTVKTIGLVIHNRTTWVRFAVTNNSSGFVSAMPAYQEVEGKATNLMTSPYVPDLNGLAPGEGHIIEVLAGDYPALWRPVVASGRPFTRTSRIIAVFRAKFAPRMKIAAIDQRFVFAGQWRHSTNAEPGDVVGVSGKQTSAN